MHVLPKLPTNCKKFPRGRATVIWFGEFRINARDTMRIELLREPGGRATVDIRRWTLPSNGGNSTDKGVAFDLRHLPSVVEPLNALLRHAREAGLLEATAERELQTCEAVGGTDLDRGRQ